MVQRWVVWCLLTIVVAVAGGSFWQTVITIEKRFYADRLVNAATQTISTSSHKVSNVEQNSTKDGATDPSKKSASSNISDQSDLSTFADEKIGQFNHLVSLLKERPYEVRTPKNPFYDAKRIADLIPRLKNRIAINREYGYIMAVDRDKIALETLMLKERIYLFFTTLAEQWTEMDRKALKQFYQKQRQWLGSIRLDRYTQRYREAKKREDKISLQIIRNYEQLRIHYLFFSDFLDYLINNPTILEYRSLMSLFRLDQIIDRVNAIDFFAKINTHLRHLHTDVGRLLLFALIIFFSWGMAYWLYFKLYRLLKARIEAHEDRSDAMMLHNLDGMRRPFFIFIITVGFRLAMEVLLHPLPLPESLALFFYAIILATVAYVLLFMIDSLFFDYLVNRGKLQDRQLRQELINLILSIIKMVVVVIAIAMLLVRMGVNITGVLASLGIGGLAVALAAQNTLSNFFGLLKIIFDNAFSQGDWIETKEIEGTVVQIGFISTMVRTFDNALITVPNAVLANSPLKNWSKRSIGRRIKMHIGLTYDSPREAVVAAIQEIEAMLIAHPGIATPQKVKEHSIILHRRESKLVSLEDKYGIKSTLLVYLDEFADSSINILIYCFSKSVVWQEWLTVKQDVMLKIWAILERHGLSFAFPSESIYFSDENVKECLAPLWSKIENGATWEK